MFSAPTHQSTVIHMQFVKTRLESMLHAHEFLQKGEDVRPVLRGMLAEVEQELAGLESRIGHYSGTTAVLALIQGRTLTVANIGDSRAVLGRRKKHKRPPGTVSAPSVAAAVRIPAPSSSSAKPLTNSTVGESCRQSSPVTVVSTPSPTVPEGQRPASAYVVRQLSVDHKPDRRDEYERILASGGRVFSVRYDDGVVGPPRVWLQSSNTPGLAMSRSLGDLVVHTVGVSSEPEFYQMQLDPARDQVLVLATDGLWDVMSNQEAVDAAALHATPQQAVLALLAESHRRWMHNEDQADDTTVCVVHLATQM